MRLLEARETLEGFLRGLATARTRQTRRRRGRRTRMANEWLTSGYGGAEWQGGEVKSGGGDGRGSTTSCNGNESESVKRERDGEHNLPVETFI
jgi:hypothetical protein